MYDTSTRSLFSSCSSFSSPASLFCFVFLLLLLLVLVLLLLLLLAFVQVHNLLAEEGGGGGHDCDGAASVSYPTCCAPHPSQVGDQFPMQGPRS